MIAQAEAVSPQLTALRIEEGARSVLERGYYVVENSLSPEQCASLSEILDGMIERGESDGNGEKGGFGYHVAPLCPRHEQFCEMLCDRVVLGIAAAILEDEPQLKTNGMRVSAAGQHTDRLHWHTHHNTPEANAIDSTNAERGTRPRRLLCTWYMEGCNPESGPLVVYPRHYSDSLAPLNNNRGTVWPGEVHVSCPPGSGVIFSAHMWHAALAGTAPNRRHLIGVQFQGRTNPEPHMEDEVYEGPVIDAVCATNPVFARLIGRD